MKDWKDAPACPVCHIPYNCYYQNPRIIPRCGHTLCEKCIIKQLNIRNPRKIITCPNCSLEVILRRSIQEEFPSNSTILDLVNSLKKQDRRIVELCHDHGKELQLRCSTCKYFKICSHCVLFGVHKDHQYFPVGQVTPEDQVALKEALEALKGTMHQKLYPNTHTNISSLAKQILSDGLAKSLKTNFRQLFEIIQKKQAQILSEVQELQDLGRQPSRQIDPIAMSIIEEEIGLASNVEFLLREYDAIGGIIEGVKKGDCLDVDAVIDQAWLLHNKIQELQKKCKQQVQVIIGKYEKRIQLLTFFKLTDCGVGTKDFFPRPPLTPIKASKPLQDDDPFLDFIHESKPVVVPHNHILRPNHPIKSRPPSHKTNKIQDLNAQVKEKLKCDDQKQLRERRVGRQIDKSKDKKQPQLSFEQYPPQYSEEKKKDKEKIIEAEAPKETKQKEKKKEKQKLKQEEKEKERIKDKEREKDKTSGRDTGTREVHKPSKEQIPFTIYSKHEIKSSIELDIEESLDKDLINEPQATKTMSYELERIYSDLLNKVNRQRDTMILDLTGCEITDGVLPYLMKTMYRENIKFNIIKLIKNQISDIGFKAIAWYLSKDSQVKVLNLTNNKLTDKSVYILVALVKINKFLKTIYLTNNIKISQTHIKKHKDFFIQNNVDVIL